MFQLRKDNPEQHRILQEYLFIRRADNYWAAISPDLVIEQTLMRSMKTIGVAGMQNLTGLGELIVENHAEAISSRKARDLVDIKKIVLYIEPLEPFGQDSQLLSVVTGVRASSSVNADDAKSLRETILKNMEAIDIEK